MLDPKVACFIQLMDIVSALISFIDGTLALKIVFDTYFENYFKDTSLNVYYDPTRTNNIDLYL